MTKLTNAALGVVVALSITAGALYAACTDNIMRLSDGTKFELQQRISRLEGGWGISIEIDGVPFGLTFGAQHVEYGRYLAEDGSQVLVKCSNIGSA